MRRIGFLLILLTIAPAIPAAAQARRPAAAAAPNDPYPPISPRGFFLFGQQHFTAEQTFEAVFGKTALPFLGGGADIVFSRNFFIELAFSKFEETGQRVFQSGGETFPLGIPLTVKIRPFEFSGGYRLTAWRRVIPYAGIGLGSYHYEETSGFSQSGEDVDVSKKGFILMGGAEVRIVRWAGISFDVHHTSVDDIIGAGGISQEFDENDIGGTAFRVRIMVGR